MKVSPKRNDLFDQIKNEDEYSFGSGIRSFVQQSGQFVVTLQQAFLTITMLRRSCGPSSWNPGGTQTSKEE